MKSIRYCFFSALLIFSIVCFASTTTYNIKLNFPDNQIKFQKPQYVGSMPKFQKDISCLRPSSTDYVSYVVAPLSPVPSVIKIPTTGSDPGSISNPLSFQLISLYDFSGFNQCKTTSLKDKYCVVTSNPSQGVVSVAGALFSQPAPSSVSMNKTGSNQLTITASYPLSGNLPNNMLGCGQSPSSPLQYTATISGISVPKGKKLSFSGCSGAGSPWTCTYSIVDDTPTPTPTPGKGSGPVPPGTSQETPTQDVAELGQQIESSTPTFIELCDDSGKTKTCMDSSSMWSIYKALNCFGKAPYNDSTQMAIMAFDLNGQSVSGLPDQIQKLFSTLPSFVVSYNGKLIWDSVSQKCNNS